MWLTVFGYGNQFSKGDAILCDYNTTCVSPYTAGILCTVQNNTK